MAATNQEQSTVIRAPIVVVMGHVDHGKSKILETIRQTKMLEKESGGITQHIGAYEVEHKGKKITFIDTPGHEAFSKLRTRGATIADIAILVVAADEGVKPQTKEAIEIIRSNNLPFVVALNKIDRPEANPERVKQELAKEEVLVESYGGKIPSVEVSAKDGKNLDELLEMLLLVAELEHLTADPKKSAEGVVIETHRDARRGSTATLLIRDGTLRRGNFLTVGGTVENVKILENFLGDTADALGPSSPAVAAGLSRAPTVGETFHAFTKRGDAEQYAASLPTHAAHTVSRAHPTEEGTPVFNIIMKTDVAGSQEALEELIRNIKSPAIVINIIKSEVGDINESDIKMAQATGRVTIAGFKVGMDAAVGKLAEETNVRVLRSDIIYELVDALKQEIEERIPSEVGRSELGKAKILKIFKREGAKQIVGGRVEEGVIKKGAKVEIQRMKEIIGAGTILELQRNKTPAGEVERGSEFGVLADVKPAIEEGDTLIIFEEELTKRTLHGERKTN